MLSGEQWKDLHPNGGGTPNAKSSSLKREANSNQQDFSSPSQGQPISSLKGSPIDNYLNSSSVRNQSSGKQVTFQSRNSEDMQQHLSFEQETIYLNMIKNKDEEIKFLKDELKKCDSYRPHSHRQTSSPSPLRITKDSDNQMQQRLNGLEQQIDNLRTDKQELEGHNQQLMKEISNLKSELQQNMSQRQQDQVVQDQQMNTKYQKMYSQIARQEQEINDLLKDKEITQKIISSLELQLREAHSQVKQIQDLRDKDKTALRKLEEEQYLLIQNKDQEIEQLRRLLHQETNQSQSLKNQIAQLNDILSEIQQSNSSNHVYNPQQRAQDEGEINFYLSEMKSVKERIVQNIYDIKSNLAHQRFMMSSADDFHLDFLDSNEELNIDPRSIVFQVKDLVRKELEHLLILNSFSLELQQFTFSLSQQQSQKNLLQNQMQKREQNLRDQQYEQLRIKLSQMIRIAYDVDENQNLENLVDVIDTNLNDLRRENDSLNLQNSHNELKLKTILGDLELLKDANSQLQSELSALKNEESMKAKHMETQMMDKLKLERAKNISLTEENEDLASRNKSMQSEIGKLLMRVEDLESQNQELNKDCQILQTKINLMNDRQQTYEDLQSNVEKLKIQHQKSSQKIKERIADSDSSSYHQKKKSTERVNLNQKFQGQFGEKIYTDSDHQTIHSQQHKEVSSSGKPVKRGEENEKINSLIDEYRKENEKCAQKIQDLQLKLKQSQNIISTYDAPNSSSSYQKQTREASKSSHQERTGNPFIGI